MKHLRLAKRITALFLTMVMLFSNIILIFVFSEDVYIDYPERVFNGEYGKINITLKNAVKYTIDDFSYIPIRMVVQEKPTKIAVYITQKTKSDTDAALASIKTEIGKDIAHIEPDYSIATMSGGTVAGDANGDYLLTLADASYTLKYVAGWNSPVFYAANVNYDHIINLDDVTLMLKLLAGWESVQHFKWRET